VILSLFHIFMSKYVGSGLAKLHKDQNNSYFMLSKLTLQIGNLNYSQVLD